MRTLVLDNGAGNIKAGYTNMEDPLICPNAIIKAKNERKRVFIGPDIKDCKDRNSLFYVSSFERGYLANFTTEQQVWDRLFSKEYFDVKFEDTSIALTDPVYCVPATNDVSTEVLFEDFGFAKVMKLSSAQCAYERSKGPDEHCLVVDCGYSFTHIVPMVYGMQLTKGIKRMTVGGKILTNQLKDWITYRQMHMLEETYLINDVKEKCCYVSTDINVDMNKLLRGGSSRREIVQEYVLPDFVTTDTGYVRLPADPVNPEHASLQRITMGNERFRIPEIIFNPSDIGILEMGISECIADSVNSLNEATRLRMLKNIVLVGGSVQFPGFKERLKQELRALVDENCDINVHSVNDPVTRVWKGACDLSEKYCNAETRWVTKKDYLEHGPNVLRKRFLMRSDLMSA